jgi:hypothetical protein
VRVPKAAQLFCPLCLRPLRAIGTADTGRAFPAAKSLVQFRGRYAYVCASCAAGQHSPSLRQRLPWRHEIPVEEWFDA